MLESDVQGLLSGSSSLLTITLYSLSSDSFNAMKRILFFTLLQVSSISPSFQISSPEYGRRALPWSTVILGVKGLFW